MSDIAECSHGGRPTLEGLTTCVAVIMASLIRVHAHHHKSSSAWTCPHSLTKIVCQRSLNFFKSSLLICVISYSVSKLMSTCLKRCARPHGMLSSLSLNIDKTLVLLRSFKSPSP